MKLSFLFFCLITAFATPVLADEDVKIVERKTCEQIKSEIANLSAMETLDADQQAELKQLTAQQRANCGSKSVGRRIIPRAQPVLTDTVSAPDVISDALMEYMNNKKSNCEKLNAEIEKLSDGAGVGDELAEMQRVYDMDCVEHQPQMQINAEPIVENIAPAKTPEEIAAEYDANLAAGLCGDGTKANRYGCCTGEVFKDLGDSVFACCPKIGDGLCFPPIK